MSKVVTTEIIEENKPESKEPESKEPELQAEKAEEQAEQAEESEEESKEAAEIATEAARAAAESKETTEKLTSYNESVINGLMDNLQLVVTRVNQIATLNKDLMEDFRAVIEELRMTLELNQDQIAAVDSAANKITSSTAALIRLHKEQTETTE